ncbi:sensitivity to high expression protein she9 [Tulasnella sp. JGI-2019a]|nr:sensitivity to high expression protein she9 [Tulasnella sp. JGI-2019a]KAG9035891.1 sensitivity to high expression protein she9 [Tulasnella sp. JGI-2019a]
MSQNRLLLRSLLPLRYSLSPFSATRIRRINTTPNTLQEDSGLPHKPIKDPSKPSSLPQLPPPQWRESLGQAVDRLRLWAELNREHLRRKTQTISFNASTSLQTVGTKLNVVTGYHEIEALKKQVVDTGKYCLHWLIPLPDLSPYAEKRIAELRQAAKDAKLAYELAVDERSSGQREVNDLLQRKSSWRESDVTRFTTLVRQDHINEQTEISAKQTLAESEEGVEREFNELMRVILNRYHEEQVWSDKIRSASTYGSLLALGLNVVVFVLAIVLVEPYKRKRLAQTFEKRIEEISRENQQMIEGGMASLTEHFARQEAVLSQIAGVALSPASPATSVPTSQTSAKGSSIEVVPTPLVVPVAKSKEREYAKVAGSVLAGSLMAIACAMLGKS